MALTRLSAHGARHASGHVGAGAAMLQGRGSTHAGPGGGTHDVAIGRDAGRSGPEGGDAGPGAIGAVQGAVIGRSLGRGVDVGARSSSVSVGGSRGTSTTSPQGRAGTQGRSSHPRPLNGRQRHVRIGVVHLSVPALVLEVDPGV